MVSTADVADSGGIERKHLQFLALIGGLARINARLGKVGMQQPLGFHEEWARQRASGFFAERVCTHFDERGEVARVQTLRVGWKGKASRRSEKGMAEGK